MMPFDGLPAGGGQAGQTRITKKPNFRGYAWADYMFCLINFGQLLSNAKLRKNFT